MNSRFTQIQQEFLKYKNPEKAKIQQGFFKTGHGQYGEGDVFLGVAVPNQRIIAKKFSDLDLSVLQELLCSKIHEHRLTSLLVLIIQYKKADESTKKKIFEFYIKHKNRINNWDLVDTSAAIVGNYLLDKDRSILYKLAKSKSVWDRRLAIIGTQEFIRHDIFSDTLKISEILLQDKDDLIHKAVGWMLREIGKKNQSTEERFLEKHYKKMPRTMLRYAIEKFDRRKREFYMR